VISNRIDRRRYRRRPLRCPIIIRNSAGVVLADTQTLDISPGGALAPVSLQSLPRPSAQVSVEVYVPSPKRPKGATGCHRTSGKVLRHGLLSDERQAAVAIAFADEVVLLSR
jgi:hypothetical protein